MSENRIPKILDEEHLLESANNSARHFRNIYAIYLTVMIYTLIIVLSTNQLSLFLDEEQLYMVDKQLPFIHISVPIVVFFTWIPWALLVLHFYLLIQAKFLFEKVYLYKQGLYARLRSREDIRKAQILLESVPLVHILVEEKAKLYLIVFFLLAALPLIVLIITSITFLPYQDEVITMTHRTVILIYLFMLWYFGFYILGSHKRKTIWINSIAGVLGILILAFVFIFINFPGSKTYSYDMADFYESEWIKRIMPTNYFVLSNLILVRKEPAPELLAAELLAAQIKDQMDDETVIEPGSPIWCQYADPLDLRGRNFRKAELQRTILCKATLQGADLTSADLSHANLTNAYLWDANLTNTYLWRANLTDAYLSYADLTSADLGSADLTSADLGSADLTSANLGSANLISADLGSADLTSANLGSANLISADLGSADLTSANLRFADLISANLSYANLIFADLGSANFISADFGNADLTSANLGSADLTSANLGSANLTAANLSRADFSNAILDGTTLDLTWVWESSGSEEEENFPRGIPRGRSDTLKPEYLCPLGFDISGLPSPDILKQRIEENCKLYQP